MGVRGWMADMPAGVGQLNADYRGQGVPSRGYRVLQCYTAWPACTKSRSRVLHKVLQWATQGATSLGMRWNGESWKCQGEGSRRSRCGLIGNFSFDQFGQQGKGFLPAEIAGFGGDDVWHAFLDDVQLRSARDFLERDCHLNLAGQRRIFEFVRIPKPFVWD